MSNNTMPDYPKMRLGYACMHLDLEKKYRTFRLKAIEEEDVQKIKEVIQHNLFLLLDILYDNIKNNIYVYRVTADIVPFPSNEKLHEIIVRNNILTEPKILKVFEKIREWQATYHLRISMHTSHFTILSSPRADVVEKSIQELIGQQNLLHLIGGQNLTLHLGGSYNDKEKTLERLEMVLRHNSDRLDFNLLTFENDDKTYTTQEVVVMCQKLGLKWVYDFHHERCNPSTGIVIADLLRAYPPDKYHLSSGVGGIIKPPHADWIAKEDLQAMLEQLHDAGIQEADIILEAKEKNRAIHAVAKPLQNGYWCLA